MAFPIMHVKQGLVPVYFGAECAWEINATVSNFMRFF
uniref:Uncharacterized protein n=1 Tax=Anopheles albimanus TaxID=7167 RepID=A0A182FZA0_ANOAL